MNNPPNDRPDRPDHPADDERFALLWTDYLEGELDVAGMAELNALLADEQLLALAADHYQTHRRLGLIASARREEAAAQADADAFIADVMERLPADGDTLTRGIMAHLAAAARPTIPQHQSHTSRWRVSKAFLVGGGLLAALAVAVMAMSYRPQSTSGPSGTLHSPAGQSTAATNPPVRFASLARARFLGRETPPRQAEVAVQETYVLSAGLVELVFPLGATAIVEAPAVFRVCGPDCLVIDAGRCSVHAPEGAEGFRVDTPATRVIDRGTRFVVSVGETSVTEVQVIEGAADVVATNEPTPAFLGLTAGDIARHDPAGENDRIVVERQPVDAHAYQRQLPDRIISFTASLSHPASPTTASAETADGIDMLETVSVQRGGVLRNYRVEQLIGVAPLHFRAGRNHNNLTTPGTAEFSTATLAATDRRALLESDRLLTTGLINPGGSQTPLSADPVLAAAGVTAADTTPGLGVRFARPVINDAGPDVVFFDLQILTDPQQGDAFHVSPLSFAPGLRSHTIDAYDIDLTSPESQLLAFFRLFTLSQEARSLADVLSIPTKGSSLQAVRAEATAVGIDLSDLGYPAGAAVDGLFFQDMNDDASFVDPVFIAGLPPLDATNSPAQGDAR